MILDYETPAHHNKEKYSNYISPGIGCFQIFLDKPKLPISRKNICAPFILRMSPSLGHKDT